MIPSLHTYKAVFFDAADTLLQIPAAKAVIRKCLEDRAFMREEEEIDRHFTEAFRRFYYGKKLNREEVCSPESDRIFWSGLYAYILERLGASSEWSELEVNECSHELYDLFTSPDQYRLFDDVPDALQQLAERGYRLGLVSNFAPTMRDILETTGIASYFDPIIVSTEVGLEKPNPQIFRLALERAGLRAEEVLYVGDHEHNDIWAPNQIGIDAVKIKRYDYHQGEGIHSLMELLD